MLRFFMLTDYAKEEQAYFQSYPYLEMAAREKINLPVAEIMMTANMKEKKVPKDKIKTLFYVHPKTPAIQETEAELVVSQVIRPKIKQIQVPVKHQVKTNLPQTKVPIVQKHRKNPPEANWQHNAKLGFDAYNAADYETATRYFEQVLKITPYNRKIRLQLAYTYKMTGQNSLAIRQFEAAIDHSDDDNASFALRREVEQLENRFEVNGYVIYRDESSGTRQLGADLTQSQAGIEVSYQPENVGSNNGRKFQIYARLLAGMEQDRFEFNPDSYQAAMGLRLKPFSNHNLVLSAERLVRMGDFARNDWMVRAGYSLDHGTDYREDKTKWWSYSLYFDAALIDPASPDIFLTSQITSGYNMTVAEGLVLQPRLTSLVSWQKDSFRRASLFEAGPGVNLRYHFNDTKYEAYRSYIDLTIEYRIKLSGNSIGSSGLVISFQVHF